MWTNVRTSTIEARDLNCDLCTLAGLAQGTSESILQESIGDGLESWLVSKRILGTPESCVVWYLHSKCWRKISAKPISLKSIFNAHKQIKKEKYCAVELYVTKSNLYANYCLLWSYIWEWSRSVFQEASSHFVKKMEIFFLSCTLLHPSQNADLHL